MVQNIYWGTTDVSQPLTGKIREREKGEDEKKLFKTQKNRFFNLNINQHDAINFIMSLFHASTCFEHKCSLSGGQNCTIDSLVSSH